MERDDFYPDRVSTHILNSSERYQKDWSVMGPRDPAMEKLVKISYLVFVFSQCLVGAFSYEIRSLDRCDRRAPACAVFEKINGITKIPQ